MGIVPTPRRKTLVLLKWLLNTSCPLHCIESLFHLKTIIQKKLGHESVGTECLEHIPTVMGPRTTNCCIRGCKFLGSYTLSQMRCFVRFVWGENGEISHLQLQGGPLPYQLQMELCHPYKWPFFMGNLGYFTPISGVVGPYNWWLWDLRK